MKINPLTFAWLLVIATLMIIAGPGILHAEEAATPAVSDTSPPASAEGSAPVATDNVVTEQGGALPVIEELDPGNIPPIIFSYWEHQAILDARNSRGLVRPPTEEELTRDLQSPQTGKVRPPPEEREITLGGIVFTAKGDWAIWLNGKRVTPTAIPKQVMDLQVHKEYVQMKWFDDYTNQIFPLRMRPHQRFNIDTRIFLPG